MLRAATKSDIDSLAKIHFFELQSDFLPSLGKKFLHLLYSDLLGSDKTTILVSVSGSSNVQGFVVGSTNFNSVFKKIIVKNFIRYTFVILAQIIKRPSSIKNFFETLFYTKKEGKNLSDAELIIIAVSKAYHRKGLGTKLVLALERNFLINHVKSYKVTVNDANFIANSFYCSIGFTKKHSFFLYGKKVNLYLKQIK